LAFLGTPDAAVAPLRALHQAGYDIALVVTQPDKRRGRGAGLLPSPVKAAAVELGLPVSHTVDDVLAAGVELGVVVAFGKLVKPQVLDAVPMVNVHFSLLPRWRGAAPVERAILAGDTETGVCLMQLEAGLDTGPVLGRRVVAIGPDETATELRRRLTEAGTELLLAQLSEGLAPGVAQAGEATYAAKIDPAELQLDWTQPAEVLHRVVRVGRAWTTFRGKRIGVCRSRVAVPVDHGGVAGPGGRAAVADPTGRAGSGALADGAGQTGSEGPDGAGTVKDGPDLVAIHGSGGDSVLYGTWNPHQIAESPPERPGRAAGELDGVLVGTGKGVLELIEVQPEGRPAMAAKAWVNGARPRPGERLGQ
jgi:methionyl-tRNA formyltransferase